MLTFAIIIIAFALLILIGMERERISHVLNELMMLVVRPFDILTTSLGGLVAGVSNWMRREIQEDPEAAEPDTAAAAQTPGDAAVPAAPVPRRAYHLNRILCAVIFTILAVIMCPPDAYLVRMSLSLMGLAGNAEDTPPIALDWLAAISLVACGVFWGIILFDLYRGTHLLPEQFVSGKIRPVLTWTAYTCFILCLSAIVVLGIWRGMKISGAAAAARSAPTAASDSGSLQIGGGSGNAAPDAATGDDAPVAQGGSAFDVFAASYFNTILSLVVYLSMAVAVCGIVLLLRYLSVLVVGLLLLPLALFFLAVRMAEQGLISAIYLKDRLLEFLEGLGQRIIRNLWPPVEAYRDAWHRKVRASAERWAPPAQGGTTQPVGDSGVGGTTPASGPGSGTPGAPPTGGAPTTGSYQGVGLGQGTFSGAHPGANGHSAAIGTMGAATSGHGTAASTATAELESEDLDDWNWG